MPLDVARALTFDSASSPRAAHSVVTAISRPSSSHDRRINQITGIAAPPSRSMETIGKIVVRR